jgi:hypothetical protein
VELLFEKARATGIIPAMRERLFLSNASS